MAKKKKTEKKIIYWLKKYKITIIAVAAILVASLCIIGWKSAQEVNQANLAEGRKFVNLHNDLDAFRNTMNKQMITVTWLPVQTYCSYGGQYIGSVGWSCFATSTASLKSPSIKGDLTSDYGLMQQWVINRPGIDVSDSEVSSPQGGTIEFRHTNSDSKCSVSLVYLKSENANFLGNIKCQSNLLDYAWYQPTDDSIGEPGANAWKSLQ